MRHVLLLAALLSLGAAGEAAAHARLLHSTPSRGASVKSPKTIRLAFSETIEPAQSSVAVTGPGGKAALGPLALDPKDNKVVIVPVTAPLKPGAYHLAWGMTSADSHHTEGAVDFKVTP